MNQKGSRTEGEWNGNTVEQKWSGAAAQWKRRGVKQRQREATRKCNRTGFATAPLRQKPIKEHEVSRRCAIQAE